MRIDEDIWAAVKPHKWKYQDGRIGVRGILWHATRSGLPNRTSLLEYQSCLNWFRSPNNAVRDSQGRPWFAGMSNYVIGGGKIALAVPEELCPRYSAGVHDSYAISVEVGQGQKGDTYGEADIERCHELAAYLSDKYGFKLGRLPYVGGSNEEWPGEVGHQDTEQGRGQGKSDPGEEFWSAYLAPKEVDWMANNQQVFDALVSIFGGAEKILEAKANGMDFLLGYALEQIEQDQLGVQLDSLRASGITLSDEEFRARVRTALVEILSKE